MIFIIGEYGAANLLSWQSRRLRRVARSTIAAEALSALNCSEAAMLLSNQVAEIMNIKPLPIRLIIDNESLANAAYSTTSVEEKRLRIV